MLWSKAQGRRHDAVCSSQQVPAAWGISQAGAIRIQKAGKQAHQVPPPNLLLAPLMEALPEGGNHFLEPPPLHLLWHIVLPGGEGRQTRTAGI